LPAQQFRVATTVGQRTLDVRLCIATNDSNRLAAFVAAAGSKAAPIPSGPSGPSDASGAAPSGALLEARGRVAMQ
jgi:hypothetical protein